MGEIAEAVIQDQVFMTAFTKFDNSKKGFISMQDFRTALYDNQLGLAFSPCDELELLAKELYSSMN